MFVPFTPEEAEKYAKFCTDQEHNPPSNLYYDKPMKWRCPSCGREVIISPTIITC